ncbi:MAG TPA: hypothetical protein VMS55_08715 [Myxococcota bacterium]|nr:hypothetical protein [Myxococcota bacterium]
MTPATAPRAGGHGRRRCVTVLVALFAVEFLEPLGEEAVARMIAEN